jgi:hypothetical protein
LSERAPVGGGDDDPSRVLVGGLLISLSGASGAEERIQPVVARARGAVSVAEEQRAAVFVIEVKIVVIVCIAETLESRLTAR